MDAHDLLIADHNRVRGLFTRCKAASEQDDVVTMEGLVRTIVDELVVHTTIEEEIYYPAITDLTDEIHDIVAEGVQEHHVAKQLMGELDGVEPGSDAWVAKVKVLMEGVEHHAGEEEKEMFPPVRKAMSGDDLATLGDRLQRRKAELGAAAPLIDLTKEELLVKAREQQIPGRSKMSRGELAITVDPRG